MDYIQNNLLEDEAITYHAKPHWIIFLRTVILFCLSLLILIEGSKLALLNMPAVLIRTPLYVMLGLIFMLYSIYIGIQNFIFYYFSEYAITNQRIIIKTGWVSRYSFEILLSKIEGIVVEQTIPGRVLNYGTIVIRGIGGSRDIFPFIPKPIHFRRHAQQQIDSFLKRNLNH